MPDLSTTKVSGIGGKILSMEKFDKKKVYNKQIAPLVQEIKCLCSEYKIPFFSAFGLKTNKKGMYDAEGSLICNAILPEVFELEDVKDSRFAEFVNVYNGFHTVSRKLEEFDADML